MYTATLQSLSQSLAEVSAKWFFFGALLGVPPSTLQAIDNQYHPDCDDCLTRMLMWLIEESSITWSEVAQAVGQIGYGDLAEQIRQSHGRLMVASIYNYRIVGNVEGCTYLLFGSRTEPSEDIFAVVMFAFQCQETIPTKTFACEILVRESFCSTLEKREILQPHKNFPLYIQYTWNFRVQ